MVLFQHGRGFLEAVLQPLRRFQTLEAVGPAALPVERESAEAKNGYTEAHQAAVGDAVQVAKPRGTALELPG
jgi:hypothetical protein